MSMQSVIETFEFDRKWIESGFLCEGLCEQLLVGWNHGSDKNIEHYRYYVFRNILNSEELTFDEFLKYIELCELEFETVLYCSPLIDLVKWRGLTPVQIEHLNSRCEDFPAPVKKAIEKWLNT